jgi:predicted metal-dependent peptidase
VLKEEMQVDPDSFDYIFYHYGMEMYGNMPLIEPLETREIRKVEDFVIVIDTSMSCKGELVQKFLEETYTILASSESMSRQMRIHIIQCDEEVRSDQVIVNSDELKEYMEHLEVRGMGGTDFRPAFAYVEELLAKKAFGKLRGMIYFTDGYGIFPAKKPVYDTAFVFMKEDYQDLNVPPWAIKLILDPDEIGADV